METKGPAEDEDDSPFFLGDGMNSTECFFEDLYKQNVGELKVYHDRC